jgi:hypothetical protein
MSRCIDVGAGGNGSSGRHVVKHVLEPLVAQVAEAKAPVVVTLGQEAAGVLAGWAGVDTVKLTRWWPLVHPGNPRAEWRQAHQRWVRARG